MANNTRTYSIVINGVEQSVKAVDALLQKIDALDERISKLSKLSIDLGAVQNSVSRADNGGSKYDAAKSEAAAQKEIANQIALQNAENQKALQLLVQKKQETKEQVKIQQQIAQGVRDTNGEYANTLNGQRALLSEMKKQIGNMDIDDAGTRAFAEQINQVTEKIKEMEEAYGTFTRNVGNYKSAAEGFQGFNITIGETVRNFGSLREAAKTIKNEMMGIDTSTAEGRAQFEAYEQALHQVSVAQVQMSDAAERAATSAKGLHDVLEMMEGLTAVAGIGQGISSLFGLDDTGLGEQIAKLQSLMTILQSIKTLQDQMERGVGGGGWIAKLWKGLDNPIASLKKLSAGLRSAKTDITAVGNAGNAGAAGMTALATATKGATAAMKAFGKATIILAVLQLVAEAIGWVVDGFKELVKVVSNPAYESQERAMDNIEKSANAAADSISAYNDELERQVTSGMITPIEASVQALDNLEKKLDDNVVKLHAWAMNLKDEGMRTDLTAMFSKKSADEAIANLQAMEAQLKNMDPASKEFNNQMKFLALNTIRSMQEVNLSGGDELAKFINALNSSEFGQTAMLKFMDSLPEASRASFQTVLNNFYSMADQMANRAAQLQNQINSFVNNMQMKYLQLTNPTEAIRKRYEAERAERKKLLDAGRISEEQYQSDIYWSNKAEKAEIASQNKRTASVKSGGRARVKATQSAGRSRANEAQKIAAQLEAIEKRIQSDKIATMRDGLAKTLAQLDLERRNRIEQAEKIRKEVGEKGEEAYQRELLSIQELYAKKEYDAKKEWADKWNEYQNQLARQTEQNAREYQNLLIEYFNLKNQNWLDSGSMQLEIKGIKNIVRDIGLADEEIQRIVKESGVNDILEKYLKNPMEETLNEAIQILDKFNIELQATLGYDGKPQFSFFSITDDEEYYRTLKRLGEIKDAIGEIDYDKLQDAMADISGADRLKEIHEEIESMSIEDADIEQLDKYIERLNELEKELDELEFNPMDEEQEQQWRALIENVDKLEKEYANLYDKVDMKRMSLSNPHYLLQDWQTYYNKLYDMQIAYAEKVKETNLEQIGYEKDDALFDENEEYDKIIKDIEEKYQQHLEDMRALQSQEVKDKRDQLFDILDIYGIESDEYAQAYEEYKQLAEDEILLTEDKNNQLEHAAHMHELTVQRIEDNANEKKLKAENDFIRESQTATANYYSGLLNELSAFQNKFVQKMNKVSDKSKNAWGIVNLGKYSKGIEEVRSVMERFATDLEEQQKELLIKLASNKISLGDFNTAYNELEGLREETAETLEQLNEMSKNKIGEFIESINTYIQAVGQGLTELLSTVWDAQSAALDAQQEALEKANSELEKQLTKQQEITQRHADKINQIEDELSTARGDRRQHLIDSLSAQIAAQRASLAAEQRIQKQKEANEKKQDALDKKRKEAQRKQDITSAIISTALATANGLATKPFVPVGIAMGALAAALGAAQVAIISSKHYANGGVLDGGVADGPRHSQGGIKVLGGRAEIEGGEFITNRRTTKENAGVLDFINSKKRKLNLDDFVEYYSKAGRNSVIGTRNKFANGGELPTLSDNVEVVNPSQTVIFNQDDRPVWVSVKDINDAQARVRNVQVLAGMK